MESMTSMPRQVTVMDEDILFYLSTLSHDQQKQLDDFVSISDPAPPPETYAYGNSIGANHYFGRPVSVYEPFVSEVGMLKFFQENEFSSLPPDVVDPIIDQANHPWEAEDAEYIETLNEIQDNYPQIHYTSQQTVETIAVDVHFDPDETHIYATVNKPKKYVENDMTTSDRSVSDPPREKFPKIMTESCYGQLNNISSDFNKPSGLLWNCYEQDLIHSMENIDDENHQGISSLMTDSSIIDGVSSMDSSLIYEQIPSLTSSSIDMQRSGQRKIKWWDDLNEHAEESVVEEGELMFRFLIL